MIWPTRGGKAVVVVLMVPKPETVCKPGWLQAPLVPFGSTQTGAVCGLVRLGVFKYVRLNMLTNSTRRFMLILSLIWNLRPRPMFSTGRRSVLKWVVFAAPPNWPGPGLDHAAGFNTIAVLGLKQW